MAVGAGFGEKSPERLAQCNGYRDRDWEIRAGTVELRIPKLRKGLYFPGFLEPRRMAEPFDRLAPAKAGFSRLCAEIDERVTAFLDRPIEGTGRI